MDKKHLDFNERVAVFVTRTAGSMPMAYILIAWYLSWILFQLLLGHRAFDPYPFTFLLFLSNALQLWWLPIISVGQNVISREDEIQKKRIEDLLVHIAQVEQNQVDTMEAVMNALRIVQEDVSELVQEEADTKET